jgi:hypothetical protein
VRHARTAGLPTQRGGGCEARTEGSFRASSTMKSLPSPYIFLKGTLLHGIGPPVSRKSMRAAVQSANLSRVPHAALCEVRTCPYLFLFKVHDVHVGNVAASRPHFLLTARYPLESQRRRR